MKARRWLRGQRLKNLSLIDALAQRYSQRPCDMVGMHGADPMERLKFDHLCMSAGVQSEPKVAVGGHGKP